MEHRPYLYAAVAAVCAPFVYVVYSFWLKHFVVRGSGDLVLLALPFVIFAVGSVASVAVLAWYDGNKASVVGTALVFAAAPMFGSSTVGSEFFFLDIAYLPMLPALLAFFLLGAEWSYRRRGVLSEFLGTRLGKTVAVVGAAHVAAGLYAQAGARSGFSLEFGVLLFSIVFLSVVLFAVVFLPAFLWHERRLYAPVVVSAAWLLSGVWTNYYLWDSYPVSGIHPPGSVAPFAPAPDYAAKVVLPLTAVVLAAVFETVVRETSGGEQLQKRLNLTTTEERGTDETA